MYCYVRFFSRVAQNAVNFALVLLIVEETGLASMSSLLVLALVIPATVAGLVAGVAADHLPKRVLSATGDAARGLICVYFARADLDVPTYFLVAIVLSTATQFATSAQGAMGPLIVEREDLTRANAINQAVGGAAQIVGLGIMAPVALRVFDSPTALFWVAAGLFFLAAIQALLIGRLRRIDREEVGDLAPGGFWTVGWVAMRRDRAVWQAAIELTLISTAVIIFAGLIPTYITDILGLPVDIGAIILSPAAAGVAIGLRVANYLSSKIPHAALSTLGFVIFVVVSLGVAFVEPLASFLAGYGALSWLDDVSIGNFDGAGVLAMLFALPLGFGFATVTVAANTVINERISLRLQGRVQATQSAMSAVAASLPVVAAGFLADWIGVVPVIAMVAIGIGLAAILNQRRSRAGMERVAAGTGIQTH
jgi:MFS family permease